MKENCKINGWMVWLNGWTVWGNVWIVKKTFQVLKTWKA